MLRRRCRCLRRYRRRWDRVPFPPRYPGGWLRDMSVEAFYFSVIQRGCSSEHHFKWIAASVLSRAVAFPFFTFGIQYLGLISWHPFSQYTPPAADSGSGIGLATAKSRSASTCFSTSEISF